MADIIKAKKLKSIIFDFENRKFEINGTDIGFYSEVEVSFKDGKWTVKLELARDFDRSGKSTF